MKRTFISVALIAITLLTMTACSGQSNGVNNFNIKRGTNLSHWLSQSRVRGEARKQHIQERKYPVPKNLKNLRSGSYP